MHETFSSQELVMTGNPEIDTQHQEIIALANTLADGLSPDDLRSRLHELYGHIREHFDHEEQLMQDLRVPDMVEHMKEHNLMLVRVAALIERGTTSEKDCDELRKLVANWVREHVLGRDTNLGVQG